MLDKTQVDPDCRRRFFDGLAFACLVVALLGGATRADAEGPDARSEDIEEIEVESERPAGDGALALRALDSGRAADLSQAVYEMPGVSGVRRGAAGLEPVVRGLGWERVVTQIGGLRVQGAGPGRMDPPATLFGTSAVRSVVVVKGIPSVTLGPGGTGGRILVSSDYERPAEATPEIGGRLQGGYQGDRTGGGFALVVEGGNDWLDLRAGLDGHQGGDYESADGDRVPASARALGASLSAGLRLGPGQRLFASYLNSEHRDSEFPSLRMDSDEGSSHTVNAGYRLELEQGVFAGVELSAGYAGVDHLMSNRHKPTWSRMQAESRSSADAVATSLETKWRFGAGGTLLAGLDFSYLKRDALRERRLWMDMGMGMGMWMEGQDRLWPDARQWDLGIFAELDLALAPGWRARLGARLDRAHSDARAADAPSLASRSVREWYVFYYGADAADVSRGDTLGSGNALVEWKPLDELTTRLGVGVSSRAPSITERYFAFAAVSGGYQVGDPSLPPEKKVEIEWGADWSCELLEASISLFHSWIDDYILSTRIGTVDLGAGDTSLWGFRSVRARTYGGEVQLVARAGRHLSFPMSAAYVRGRNTSEGRDLPEIPPFEARVAARLAFEGRWPCWFEMGGRFAAGQDRIDRDFGEDESDPFDVYHLRAGVELISRLHLELGIENLLDEQYHDHLSREAALPAGDLAPGDEIPSPGRSVYVSARWEF